MKYEVDYPVAFHTVDMAIVRVHEGKFQVLLIQKKKEVEAGSKFWRYPGGFVDPTDASAEAAALREGAEETHMTFAHDAGEPPLYIGSSKIDDPRFLKVDHKVITSFFRLNWKSGDDGQGFDDVASTKWFDVDQVTDEVKNPIHRPLFALFEKKFNKYIEYNKLHRTADEFTTKFDDHVDKLGKTVADAMKSVSAEVENIFKLFKD